MDYRTTTIRIPEDMAEALELAARVDEVSVSQAIRNAIEDYLRSKTLNQDFQNRLSVLFESERNTYKKLSKKR